MALECFRIGLYQEKMTGEGRSPKSYKKPERVKFYFARYSRGGQKLLNYEVTNYFLI